MKRIPEPSVAVLIPSMDNFHLLSNTLTSMKGTTPFNMVRVYVLNNGHPDLAKQLSFGVHGELMQMDGNVGWERALDYGVKHTTEPFVMFLNDDVHFLPLGDNWLHRMLSLFADPTVGAVGPMSNIVAGQQNLFTGDWRWEHKQVKFLIGFCMLLRREALEKAGGVDVSAPGGDDLDLSIRLRQQGYKLIACRNAFVFHHAFQTGQRVHGKHWNSEAMQDRTNNWLIHKHGIKAFHDVFSCTAEPYSVNQGLGMAEYEPEAEGLACLPFVNENPVLELGCGNKKTVEQAVGVDIVKNGEAVKQLQGLPSVADVQADVEEPLPLASGSQGTVIARHILEHCVDTVGVLKEWSRLLTPTGHLVIAVPDQRLRNTIPLNVEHCHAFTPDSLKALAEAVGLECIGVREQFNGLSFVMAFQLKPQRTEAGNGTAHPGITVSVGL